MSQHADSPPDRDAFDAAVRQHDEAVAAAGLTIWIGGEPTFTDRFSDAPEWHWEALGEAKLARARHVVAALATRSPGALLLRSIGKQYPGEPVPRWSYGLLARRDGAAVWAGPPDPVVAGGVTRDDDVARRLRDALVGHLGARGVDVRALDAAEKELPLRLVCALGDEPLPADVESDPRTRRDALERRTIPPEGLVDDLAVAGVSLVCVGLDAGTSGSADEGAARVELPAVPRVAELLALVADLADAARDAQCSAVIVSGHPPPVDASVAWLTVAPDPAVVEVNTAPSPTVAGFVDDGRAIFDAARDAGLAPYRLHFNGDEGDSGGGGQITLGGETPEASPFFVSPLLVPRLVTYFNRHPALSYTFAFDCIGGSSQSPRADEGRRESFEELQLALALLERASSLEPETIWASLAPFLTDPVGNAHRSEINIEKLWNPWFPGRGRLGLVELRALRMSCDSERAGAVAALFRAIAAHLSQAPCEQRLVDWGAELHDRFALPWALRRDLCEVLNDLERGGFGLGEPIVEHLLDDSHRLIGRIELGGLVAEVRRAVEFWPVLGDQTQQHGTSRPVDASTERVEVLIRDEERGGAALESLHLAVDGHLVEPVLGEDERGAAVAVMGFRFCNFVPAHGFHPTLHAHGPLSIDILPAEAAERRRLTLHTWIPGGGAYDGLPADLDTARRRRRERLVIARLPAEAAIDSLPPPPPESRTPYCVDTRWFAGQSAPGPDEGA